MIVLADTSAWIEFLRGTGSRLAYAMRRRLEADEVATTDVIIMEVLAGAADEVRLAKIRRAVDGCRYLAQRRRSDAAAAAAVYRQCRRAGETPRQLADCLVAAVALRSRVPVLQRDRDYGVISRRCGLEVVSE